jgi:hypothetical protein
MAPDNTDRLEFTVDKTTCASLAAAKPADPNTLSEMAQTVAQRENTENRSLNRVKPSLSH